MHDRQNLRRHKLPYLQQAISANDQPPWLRPVQIAIQTFLANPTSKATPYALLQVLIAQSQAIESQKWHLSKHESSVDFDAVYQKHRDEGRVPELFDEMINALASIVQSKAVDSVKVLASLENLIATLKSNRKGSFFSVVGTWDFAAGLLKNYLWQELSKLPAIGSFMQALKKTLDEANTEVAKLHSGIQADLHKQLSTEFPLLTYQPPALPDYTGPDKANDTPPNAG